MEDLWILQERGLGEEADAINGFTFPTCKPVKRIDYLFYRQQPDCYALRVLSKTVRIIGRESSADTGWFLVFSLMPSMSLIVLCDLAHLVNSRPDIGMMDEDSPLWASDHMALVADISIKF